jgi:hypothetical protein
MILSSFFVITSLGYDVFDRVDESLKDISAGLIFYLVRR